MNNIESFRIAAMICGFKFDDKDLKILVETFELVHEKGGDATLQELVMIQANKINNG